MKTYTVIGADASNPATHVIIEVDGVRYSVIAGTEQDAANEIAANRQP